MRAGPDVSAGERGSVLRGLRPIALAALVACVTVAAATASAQDPLPAANYGGGRIVEPPGFLGRPGSMVISLHTGGGKVRILANISARCALATIKASATLMPDGSFSTSGTQKERDGSDRLRTAYTISGTMSGVAPTGTASARGTVKPRGRRAHRCKSGSVAWTVRRPSGDIGTIGAPAPSAQLFGLTSQSVAGRRHALALRISPSATRLTRFLYSLNVRCGRESYLSGDAPRYNLPIRANGKVTDVHRYSFRVGRRVIGRFTERFTATVGSTGASGTLSVQGRYIYRPTGQAFRHCRTGTVKWVAAP